MVYIHLLKFEGLDRRLWIQGKSCLFSITNSFALKKPQKTKNKKKNEKKTKKKIVHLCIQLVDYRAFRVKRHVYDLIKIIISGR